MSDTTALATTTPEGTLRDYVRAMEKKISEVLPAHIQPERFIRVVLGEVARTPKLALCTRESFALSLLTCSQLGLEPSSPLGHVYLIPFEDRKNKRFVCTMIVGYKGYLELTRRSGKIARINAGVVYQSEAEAGLFRAQREPPEIFHGFAPTVERPDDDLIVASYCVVVTTDGGKYQEILSRDQINARRLRSAAAAKDDGPWITDGPAMARKSAIRALIGGGTVPISAEMATAINFERRAERGELPIIDVPPDPTALPTTLDGIAAQLEATAAATVVVPPPPAEEPDKKPRKTRSDKGTTRGSKTEPAPETSPVAPSPPPESAKTGPMSDEPSDWDKAIALGETWGLSVQEVGDVLAEQLPEPGRFRWTDSQRAAVQTVIETRGKRKQQAGTVAKPPSKPQTPGF